MDFEQIIRKKYRFVLLRCPYELMDYSLVQNLLPKLIHFKTTGYRKEYDRHVLPFDTSDFIASHLLMCEQTSAGDLIPVLGMKSVTLKKCDDHRITLPMLGMLEGLQSTSDHKSVIQKMIESYRSTHHEEKLAYNGSFTIHPRLREDKVLMKYLWEVSFSLMTNYYMEYQINHVIAVCATQFNVHKKKEQHGWNFIPDLSGGKLNEYQSKCLFGASLVPMELTDVAVKGRETSEKFKDMWNDRIILDLEHLEELKKVA